MKLLNRTVRSYILYSGSLLLVAIPVFYWVLSRLVTHEIDEVLLSHKRDFMKASANFRSLDDLEHYPLLNEEFFITPTSQLIATDSFYTEYLVKPPATKPIPFRVVKTGIVIQGKPYELLVKESLLEREDLIVAIVYTQAALITILLAGLILINRGLAKKIWKPFYGMLRQLKQYDIDKHQKNELSRSDINEFEDLRQVILQLLLKNHQAYASQKEFTENASHEMQTPLAVIIAKLDLLMQTDQLTREQADLISEVLDTTHQLSNLNRSLLLLAKIENDQFRELEPIDIGETVRKVSDRLQELAAEKQTAITTTIEGFSLMANPTQIEILLSNLLSNAVRHATPKAVIQVHVDNDFIQVSNTGHPLRNPAKIFDRFQRDVTESSGSGLGLALVSKICDVNGYKIDYRYREGMHFFRVNFKPPA